MMRECRAIFLVVPLLCFLSSREPNTLVCNEKQKNALLSFKQALSDPADQLRLSSWTAEEDCRGWIGVHCHSINGQVMELIRCPMIEMIPRKMKVCERCKIYIPERRTHAIKFTIGQVEIA